MSEPDKSPLVEFLTRDDNLSAVLNILRYEREVRDYALERLLLILESSLGSTAPDGLLGLTWTHEESGDPTSKFGLVYNKAIQSGTKSKGLRYQIEANKKFFGFGLAWAEFGEDFNLDARCRQQAVRRLEDELKKRRRRGEIDSEPTKWWLWFEHWDSCDRETPWLWFPIDFSDK
jgi:hypothetical protein